MAENLLGDVYGQVDSDAHPHWVPGVEWKPKQKKEEQHNIYPTLEETMKTHDWLPGVGWVAKPKPHTGPYTPNQDEDDEDSDD